MDWCVQFSGFLGMSVCNLYILPPCRIVKTGTLFFWGLANQQARKKTVQRKPLPRCPYGIRRDLKAVFDGSSAAPLIFDVQAAIHSKQETIPYTTLARKLEMSLTVVEFSVERGELIEKKGNYSLEK